MNHKEKKQMQNIISALDKLYELAENIDKYCIDEHCVLMDNVQKLYEYGNELMKYLDIIEYTKDKLLNLNLIEIPKKTVFKNI